MSGESVESFPDKNSAVEEAPLLSLIKQQQQQCGVEAGTVLIRLEDRAKDLPQNSVLLTGGEFSALRTALDCKSYKVKNAFLPINDVFCL